MSVGDKGGAWTLMGRGLLNPLPFFTQPTRTSLWSEPLLLSQQAVRAHRCKASTEAPWPDGGAFSGVYTLRPSWTCLFTLRAN